MVPWTPELLAKCEPCVLADTLASYWCEHGKPAGLDWGRFRLTSRYFVTFFGIDRDPQTLKRADIRGYREAR